MDDRGSSVCLIAGSWGLYDMFLETRYSLICLNVRCHCLSFISHQESGICRGKIAEAHSIGLRKEEGPQVTVTFGPY